MTHYEGVLGMGTDGAHPTVVAFDAEVVLARRLHTVQALSDTSHFQYDPNSILPSILNAAAVSFSYRGRLSKMTLRY